MNSVFLKEEIKDEILEYGDIEFFYHEEILENINFSTKVGLLKKGLVKLSYNDNSEKFLMFHQAANFAPVIGIGYLFFGSNSNLEVKVIEPVIIVWIEKEKFTELCVKHEFLKTKLIESLTHQNGEVLKRFSEIKKSTQLRLWEYLKDKEFFYNSNLLKISNNEIAHDLNISKETISRLLTKFENEKKITRYLKKIYLNI